MTLEEFEIELSNSFNRSRKTLAKKRGEYAREDDVLTNFKRAAEAQAIPPTAALLAMATKQFISISDMVKNPLGYSLSQWNEKVGDLRNYTFLLDALVRDLGVE